MMLHTARTTTHFVHLKMKFKMCARGVQLKFYLCNSLQIAYFILHLKECEYRFNNRELNRKDFERMLLKLTKKFLKNSFLGKVVF